MDPALSDFMGIWDLVVCWCWDVLGGFRSPRYDSMEGEAAKQFGHVFCVTICDNTLQGKTYQIDPRPPCCSRLMSVLYLLPF